ncbi:class Ib ribonucleoside-diphosphate reductase assembly flavoprotein NrdI [Alkalihalobacillus clausii]|nr:class Ib ribonucleoside-diphosphate reductase assembly flavoprotein NrdI [Shouchella clausii]
MLIYYYSKTGNVKSFVGKLSGSHEIYSIQDDPPPISPFVLITHTTGIGAVPGAVQKFLAKYGHLLKAVAVSGNRIWGRNYGKAGDIISEQFSVPLIHKFELRGMPSDVKKFESEVSKFE